MNDKPVYEFTVNETPIKTPHEKLTAGDIIRLAIKQGATGVSGKGGRKENVQEVDTSGIGGSNSLRSALQRRTRPGRRINAHSQDREAR